MKQMLILAAMLAFGAAHAADAPNKQQNKMAACNKEAGDKKGDERKQFMSGCLKAKAATQQDKMKTCNKEAGEKALKGDERKAFMSQCLKA
ncbi:PsiF family protein [Chitinimonas koreensis]|uniref:PsiF family protein n=1 Tax=Chitinimonas koreensis TaxID=356302 RepID=UPI0003F6C73C|nr:PsiF family protein [Chitinimonas koreensis]QNM97211.1 phosphate starvation-inducible protein PsiF [Chitinimonas koreensis]